MGFPAIRSACCIQLFVTPWTAACQASLSFIRPPSLLKLTSIELVMPSDHLILCHPFLLLSSIFPSIRVFSNESVLCIRWPPYWSFSFSISPPDEYSGLISFRFCGIWDLNSPTRGQTHVLCIAIWILNHWTTREVLRHRKF